MAIIIFETKGGYIISKKNSTRNVRFLAYTFAIFTDYIAWVVFGDIQMGYLNMHIINNRTHG